MDRDRILLTPGPLTTTLRTKLAMLRDWGSWDADFNAVTAELRRSCSTIVHGEDTHVRRAAAGQRHLQRRGGGGDARAARRPRAGARQRRLLQARRQAHDADGPQDDVHAASPKTRRCRPPQLDAALAADPIITHVGLIHCETGTGVQNPLQRRSPTSARGTARA